MRKKKKRKIGRESSNFNDKINWENIYNIGRKSCGNWNQILWQSRFLSHHFLCRNGEKEVENLYINLIILYTYLFKRSPLQTRSFERRKRVRVQTRTHIKSQNTVRKRKKAYGLLIQYPLHFGRRLPPQAAGWAGAPRHAAEAVRPMPCRREARQANRRPKCCGGRRPITGLRARYHAPSVFWKVSKKALFWVF